MSLYKGNNLISGAMPNSANQSLSNLDSAGQDIIDNKIDLDYSNADYQPVNKSGDTMSGDLIIYTNNNEGIEIINPDEVAGTNPSYNLCCGVRFYDKNNTLVGYIQNEYLPDGSRQTLLNTRNAVGSRAASIIVGYDANDNEFCRFPHTVCVDGNWTKTNVNIISSDVSLTGSSNLTYTLNLPNDGHNYMVLITATAKTGAASGNFATMIVSSDICTGVYIASNRTRTASLVDLSGNVYLPVSSSHKIYVNRSSSNIGTLTGFAMAGYRRIGTNA